MKHLFCKANGLLTITCSVADFRLFEDPDLGGTVQTNDPLLLPCPGELKGSTVNVNLDEDTEELLRYLFQ